MNHLELIQTYQAQLEAKAITKTKLWWERYLQGAISFRGVGIPQNRDILLAWYREQKIDQWTWDAQLELALTFFHEPFAEDKLAGILFLQNFLHDKLPWHTLLPRYAQLYHENLIFDWNICDWFCIRVLGPTIALHGTPCAQAIAAWHTTPHVWQARSAVVAFVNLTDKTEYYPYLNLACSTLIQRPERFAKTAVGWILHDISKHDETWVIKFIETHLTSFSPESLKNALKYFDKERRQFYLNQHSKR